MKNNIARVSIAVVLLAGTAGYLLWSKAQTKDAPLAHEVTCVNNLKQIGIAFRVSAQDHHGQFPFNVSTNAGGVRELCVAESGGFASNPAIIFQVLTNEDGLGTPRLLVCPKDHSKKPAQSLASVGPENLTYRVRMGTNLIQDGAKLPLVVCPVDGNTLYTDGTVAGKIKADGRDQKPMEVPGHP